MMSDKAGRSGNSSWSDALPNDGGPLELDDSSCGESGISGRCKSGVSDLCEFNNHGRCESGDCCCPVL